MIVVSCLWIVAILLFACMLFHIVIFVHLLSIAALGAAFSFVRLRRDIVLLNPKDILLRMRCATIWVQMQLVCALWNDPNVKHSLSLSSSHRFCCHLMVAFLQLRAFRTAMLITFLQASLVQYCIACAQEIQRRKFWSTRKQNNQLWVEMLWCHCLPIQRAFISWVLISWVEDMRIFPFWPLPNLCIEVSNLIRWRGHTAFGDRYF